MPIISDLPAVLEMAKKARQDNPLMSKDQAAAAGLRRFYALGPQDGIWGGSDAAICMGLKGYDENTNLFDRIAADVAAHLH